MPGLNRKRNYASVVWVDVSVPSRYIYLSYLSSTVPVSISQALQLSSFNFAWCASPRQFIGDPDLCHPSSMCPELRQPLYAFDLPPYRIGSARQQRDSAGLKTKNPATPLSAAEAFSFSPHALDEQRQLLDVYSVLSRDRDAQSRDRDCSLSRLITPGASRCTHNDGLFDP